MAKQPALRLDDTIVTILETLRTVALEHGLTFEYVIRCPHAAVQQLLELDMPRKWTALCERCASQNPSRTLDAIFMRTPMQVAVVSVDRSGTISVTELEGPTHER